MYIHGLLPFFVPLLVAPLNLDKNAAYPIADEELKTEETRFSRSVSYDKINT